MQQRRRRHECVRVCASAAASQTRKADLDRVDISQTRKADLDRVELREMGHQRDTFLAPANSLTVMFPVPGPISSTCSQSQGSVAKTRDRCQCQGYSRLCREFLCV